MGKKVSEAMSPLVRSVGMNESLADAAGLMKEHDVGSLPVVDESRRLVGILTDRDIVLRAVAEGRDPRSVKVGDVASRELVTVGPDENLDDALHVMADHQVRRLPVVDDGQLVGVLAQADAAIEARDRKAGEMVAEISQPSASRDY
jgi:CBS domain-containing protein